jgi:hypothetical protein
LKPGALPKLMSPLNNLSGHSSKSPNSMTRLPSVSGERLVRALKRAGFIQLRQKGSHVSLEKRDGEKAL